MFKYFIRKGDWRLAQAFCSIDIRERQINFLVRIWEAEINRFWAE